MRETTSESGNYYKRVRDTTSAREATSAREKTSGEERVKRRLTEGEKEQVCERASETKETEEDSCAECEREERVRETPQVKRENQGVRKPESEKREATSARENE